MCDFVSIAVCETVYELENGYVDFFQAEVSYKKKANVSCNEGYFVDGDEQVECLKDGKWSKTKCSDSKSQVRPIGVGTGGGDGGVGGGGQPPPQ